jgi:predicted HTH transcriptional regulator
VSFERSALSTSSVDELDMQAVAAYVTRRAPSLRELPAEEAATRLGLLHKTGPRLSPTPVGMLCFGHSPQLLHPEWGVSAVRVDGLTLSDEIAARADLEGNIVAMAHAALLFVRDHTSTLADEVQLESAESEYHDSALREAIANALIHRDLRKTGRVALRIFDDRLEVWSPGGLPEGVGDFDDLVQHGGVSLPRNPLLAATARQLGLGEQLGRGLTTIRRAVTQLPNQRLEVRASNRDFMVVLPSRLSRPPAACRLT